MVPGTFLASDRSNYQELELNFTVGTPTELHCVRNTNIFDARTNLSFTAGEHLVY